MPYSRVVVYALNDVYQLLSNTGLHGGLGRAITLLSELRSKDENRDRTGELVVFNGDILGGSDVCELTRGAAAIESLQYFTPDCFVLGNHEFDFGPDRLAELIQQSKSRPNSSRIQWLATNVRTRSSEANHQESEDLRKQFPIFPGCSETYIFEAPVYSNPLPRFSGNQNQDFESTHSIRVGCFGLVTPSTRHTSFPGDDIQFADPIDVAKAAVHVLRHEQNCDIVIALTHLALSEDKQVAAQVPGIDLILGGHDHDPIALTVRGVPILKFGQNAYYLGRVTLDINLEDERQVFYSWDHLSTYNVPPDPALEAHLSRFLSDFKPSHNASDHGRSILPPTKKFGPDLVELEAELETLTTNVRTRSSSSGNLIADALLDRFTAFARSQGVKNLIPDFAFINGGFIRGDRIYPSGFTLTTDQLSSELPFPKAAVLVEIVEQDLFEALEQHLRFFPEPSGAFPHVSANVQVEFDPEAPPLQRIREIRICSTRLCKDNRVRTWKLVTSAFILVGGDGCSSWTRSLELLRSKENIRDIVIAYLVEQGGKITPDNSQRVRFISL